MALESEEKEKIYDRLREVELNSALFKQCLDNVSKSVDEIKSQIGSFLSQAAMFVQMQADIKSLKDWKDLHCTQYTKLISEHDQMCGSKKEEKGFWKERLGKLMDIAIPAIIIWLLFLYKGH